LSILQKCEVDLDRVSLVILNEKKNNIAKQNSEALLRKELARGLADKEFH